MKNASIVMLLAFIGISATVENETKIGYVYMELVMNNMPETQEMMVTLDKFTAEKQALIEEKNNVIAGKIKTFQVKDKAGELTEAGKIIATNEIKALQNELEAFTQLNEQEVYAKRTELLSPIAQKLETAMDAVAEKYGYKYVLNSSDGTGNSVVIVAPEGDDLTQEVMEHLGIKFE